MNSNLTALEWGLFGGFLLAVTAWMFVRLGRGSAWRWGVLGLVCVVAGLAFVMQRRAEAHRLDREKLQATVPRVGRPGGYTTSDTCRSCHPGQYETWHDSYHRTMTQYASPESVQADFGNVRLRLGDEEMRVWKEGVDYWAELPDPQWKDLTRNRANPGAAPIVKRRIGLLTGSHHMQIFWIPSTVGNQQLVFPFAWLIEDRKWFPVHSTFLRDPKLAPTQHSWNVNCIKCHATGGQPRPDRSIGGLDTRMGDIGISCEACHGPAEEHVRLNQNPIRRYQARMEGNGDASIVNPAKLGKAASAQVCGQCHGIKWIPSSENFHQEGFSFRPGQDLDASTPVVRPTRWREQTFLQAGLRQNPRFIEEHYWPDGMVRVSGRDFNGTVEAPCYQKGEMTCLSCHSMHSAKSNVSQMAVGKDSNEGCLQCHSAMRGKVEEHTHHKAGSTGNECYNCHMPHTTYGLLKAIRSHQISSPTVISSLRTGRPNACNLCHLDRSLDWTADKLAEWYRQPKPELPAEHRDTAASVVWALQGDAGQRALMAWHLGWEPAKTASQSGWISPYLAQLLADPYSAVRYIAHRSLKRQPGFGGFGFDPVGPSTDWESARVMAMEQWRKGSTNLSTKPEVLLGEGGSLDETRFESLLKRRNNRSMDLQE